MKAGLLCVAAMSVAVAAAQPHRQHHHEHKKRQGSNVDVEIVTTTDVVFETAPVAVVFVDGDGDPVSTSYETAPSTTAVASTIESTASVASTDSSVVVPAAVPTTTSSSYVQTSSSFSAPASTSEPASATTSSAAPASTSSTSDSASATGNSASGLAIAYSPYYGSGACKLQDAVNEDFEKLSGYTMVRTYGTDCNQTATVLSAAKAKGMTLMAGIYDNISPDGIGQEVDTIIDAANSLDAMDMISTVAVGNEGVNDGRYSVSDVVGAMDAARSKLSAAGFTGSVVTVDTFVAIIANPELCQKSDFAAANAHPFFDGNVVAQDAGSWVLSQAQRVSSACDGKDTMITETGWPWQGDTNGAAVPNPSNQADAIKSLQDHFSSNLILFTGFNDYWKPNFDGSYNAEQYWGLHGDAPSG